MRVQSKRINSLSDVLQHAEVSDILCEATGNPLLQHQSQHMVCLDQVTQVHQALSLRHLEPDQQYKQLVQVFHVHKAFWGGQISGTLKTMILYSYWSLSLLVITIKDLITSSPKQKSFFFFEDGLVPQFIMWPYHGCMHNFFSTLDRGGRVGTV